MLGQELAGPPDQHPRRLVARGADDVDVREEFVASQPPRRAGLVLELGVQQLGHDVVGRVIDAPVDVVGEDGAAERVIADLGVPAACEEVIAYGLLVALGHPEEHADDAHRHLRAEVGDEVEPTAATSGSRNLAHSFRMSGSSELIRLGVNIRESNER